jgi:hypothetical protein
MTPLFIQSLTFEEPGEASRVGKRKHAAAKEFGNRCVFAVRGRLYGGEKTVRGLELHRFWKSGSHRWRPHGKRLERATRGQSTIRFRPQPRQQCPGRPSPAVTNAWSAPTLMSGPSPMAHPAITAAVNAGLLEPA